MNQELEIPSGINEIQREIVILKKRVQTYNKVLSTFTFQDPDTDEPKHLYGNGAIRNYLRKTALGLR
jgi:hypothetical protein